MFARQGKHLNQLSYLLGSFCFFLLREYEKKIKTQENLFSFFFKDRVSCKPC